MFQVMENLTTLDIISDEKLSRWIDYLPEVWEWFQGRFGSKEGWVPPKVRIIEKATGTVMDYSNFEAMSDGLRET